MVKLEGSIKRFIGLSSDTKPERWEDANTPAGSSFLEADTGRVYRWTGSEWQAAAGSPDGTMQELLIETRSVRERLDMLLEVLR